MLARGKPLRRAQIGPAVHGDIPVAPGLRCRPLDGVVAVLALNEKESEFTLRSAAATDALKDHRKTGIEVILQAVARELLGPIAVRGA